MHATCTVAADQLLAQSSTYTVTATYSGDSNYAGDSGSLVETVNPGKTRVKVTFDAKPSNGNPSLVTATVNAGPGTTLVSGYILFAITSTSSAAATDVQCEGPNPNLGGNDAQPLVDGSASCQLPAGWLTLPSATPLNRRPKAAWSISIFLGPSPNFNDFAKEVHGKILSPF